MRTILFLSIFMCCSSKGIAMFGAESGIKANETLQPFFDDPKQQDIHEKLVEALRREIKPRDKSYTPDRSTVSVEEKRDKRGSSYESSFAVAAKTLTHLIANHISKGYPAQHYENKERGHQTITLLPPSHFESKPLDSRARELLTPFHFGHKS